eukprot:gnl/MRDRNA2_/MRDRNA2_97538_c0_seq1.p2 gnl/MRDRNA2_/MRDRNA2_97538_c0~~gnl/MRDRNA2_/MRDRNA2_97538_c0_seq1.p2  ORF type:complete len:142 (+),score=34.82 gnl/MRDRNA2_/MRDRNA2_97538_c0_seq1:77-502(+)
MASNQVPICQKCFGSWGAEEMPPLLEECSLTKEEYQQMRSIVNSSLKRAGCWAVGLTVLAVLICFIVLIVTDRHVWSPLYGSGGYYGMCHGIAMSQAMQRVNKEILEPKGMKLMHSGCFKQAIELPSSFEVDAQKLGKEQP